MLLLLQIILKTAVLFSISWVPGSDPGNLTYLISTKPPQTSRVGILLLIAHDDTGTVSPDTEQPAEDSMTS